MHAADEIFGKVPWPAPGDRLFTERGKWETNAQIDRSTLGGAAIQYQHAADELVAHLERDNPRGFPDLVARPVVYLYRHYLELMLKDVLREARLYFDESTESKPTHDLIKLWKPLRELIERRWDEGDDGELGAVESALLEFHEIDARGEAFRYPKTNEGAHTLPPGFLINLSSLRDGVAKIGVYLDGVNTVLAEERANAEDLY